MILPEDLLYALETIPALSAIAPESWEVTRLGGVTNRNYRLRSRNSAADGDHAVADYVLRLPGAGTTSYLNRPAGIHNAARAAAIGIAPPVVFSDPKRGWQLTRFLADCHPLASADLAVPAVRAAIARLLGRLQREAGVFQHELRPFAIADRYLDLAPEPTLLQLRQRAAPVERAIETFGRPLVPAHIDPNPSNFLCRRDGGLYLIDWEFSAMADPCWDLAAIVLEGDLDVDASAALLTAAGHTENARMMRHLARFAASLCLVASSWAYVEIAAGNDDPGLKLFAAQRRDAFAVRLTALDV